MLFYKIAGHRFRLSFPDFHAEGLSNYVPFRVESTEECLFHLSVVEALSAVGNCEPIGNFADDIADITVSKFASGDYLFRIAPLKGEAVATMHCNGTFTEAKMTLIGDVQHHFFGLNNCLMLLYAFATSNFNTLLIHASVIKNSNEGFVFLGKSGTGKSTHSRLWLAHIEGSELLNDDNPVVRIIDGKTYVFGSPWSGKTPCYKNEGVPLKGIVKLRQASENKIKKLSSLQAYAAIFPACSCLRCEDKIMNGVHRTVEQLSTNVNCYQLDCLPGKGATELCYTTAVESQ